MTTFVGYFLIKYIPYWVLMLLATTTAFTAPLIYLNNQQVIDEQLRRASNLVNEKLKTGRNLTEKYAKDALTAAQATTADLSQKVQGYTARKPTSPTKDHKAPSAASARDFLNKHDDGIDHKFPDAPTGDFNRSKVPEKHDPATDPLLA